MKCHLKTLPFLSYRYASKTVIDQISQNLHRSTVQPHLQILPLPPMLPQSQNQNLSPRQITSTPAPDTRVEPFVQPTRVKNYRQHPHQIQGLSLKNPLAWIHIQIHGYI